MPTISITAPLWRTLAITAAIGAVMLSIGLAFALRMASHIARAESLHQVLINELNHRVKNTLSTVQSIAHLTFRGAANPLDIAKFDGRLSALGRAHNVLSAEKWESAEISEIVGDVVAPFLTQDVTKIQISGPAARIEPGCALMISMALHELATNAAKYGALSRSGGRIRIEWSRVESDKPTLVVKWQENIDSLVHPPATKGFGTRLIEQIFPAQVGGQAKIDFSTDQVVCILECPLSRLKVQNQAPRA
jgi:two-component sensor histidine kinase